MVTHDCESQYFDSPKEFSCSTENDANDAMIPGKKGGSFERQEALKW